MKYHVLILGLAGLMAFSSCASTKDMSPIDRGQYPAEFSSSKAVVLYIQGNVNVSKIDDDEVPWANENQREQFVSIEPGLRVFDVGYNDGKLMSSSKVTLAAQLEGGYSYLIKAVTDTENVSFSIVHYDGGQEGGEAHFYLKRE
jgi:hypothetical protein